TKAAGGLTLGISDGSGHAEELDVRTFVNAGQAVWVGAGYVLLFNGSTFVNQAGATFAEQAPDAIGINISGTFDNEGTFTVTSGATASVNASFINNGTVEIESGACS